MKVRSKGPAPSGALRLEPRQEVQGRPDPQLDAIGKAGAGDALAGDLGVMGIGLERYQATVLGQPPSQPDRAVATQGAELEDRLGPDRARQQMQQLTLRRRDLDRRQAGLLTRPDGGRKRLVVRREQTGHVLVDGRPSILRHGGRSISTGPNGRKRPAPTERAGMETASRRAHRRERWLQRAERVSDAFGLVFVLVLVTYVLTSLLENRGWSAVTLTIATSATSVVALTSSHAKARFVRVALLLSALTVVLAVIAAASGEHTWLNFASLIQVSLLTVAMAAVLRRVVTAPKVGSRTILGALSVYAVLGILFTFVFGAIERIQGGPFFEGVQHPQGSDFLFFSYTTLTTTGYGNLVPGGQPGRLIAGFEMMAGQIFLVTLVAGLVSLWRPGEAIRRRRAQTETGSAADSPAAE
jgi:hypothetical protein